MVKQTLGQAKESEDEGLFPDSNALNWETAIAVTVTDASFAQETVFDPDDKKNRTGLSQHSSTCWLARRF